MKKVITVKTARHEGKHVYNFKDEACSKYWAAYKLLMYEFGYGGKVTDITDTAIVVETSVGSKVDITTFTAPHAEMQLLYSVVYCWYNFDNATLDPAGVSSYILGGIDELPTFIAANATSVFSAERKASSLLKKMFPIDASNEVRELVATLSGGDRTAVYELLKDGASDSDILSVLK